MSVALFIRLRTYFLNQVKIRFSQYSSRMSCFECWARTWSEAGGTRPGGDASWDFDGSLNLDGCRCLRAQAVEAIFSQAPDLVSDLLSSAMPSSYSLIKALSQESNAKQGECKKVIAALTKILVEEVQANGSYTIPNLVMVQKKATKAAEGRVKKVFGKTVQLAPRPSGHRLRVVATQKLKRAILSEVLLARSTPTPGGLGRGLARAML